jgi:hypothetical protein
MFNLVSWHFFCLEIYDKAAASDSAEYEMELGRELGCQGKGAPMDLFEASDWIFCCLSSWVGVQKIGSHFI